MRVIVAHPEQQHSYRLAAALKRVDALDRYFTTVYYRKGSLTEVASRLLPFKFRQKAKGRHCDELDNYEVIQICEFEGLIKLLCMYLPKASRLYRAVRIHVADRFAKKVAAYAVQNRCDAVVGYDYTTPLLFEQIKQGDPSIVCILDMSAANTLYMRSIYEEDFKRKPDFEKKLRTERAVVWDQELVDRCQRELDAADFFLCGSAFVVESLKYSGISEERCAVCHYGVDLDAFSLKRFEAVGEDGPLRVVYVGGTKELKGIAYLLDAFLDIPEDVALLAVVGVNNLPQELLARYENRVDFRGMVIHDDMPELLAAYDVTVMPSLGEGFSLAVLEAMAVGLPAIVSENVGYKDVITDGVDGFIVPVQDQEAIRQKIIWFSEHREEVERMGRAARETALRYTWDAYSEQVVAAVEGFVERGVDKMSDVTM